MNVNGVGGSASLPMTLTSSSQIVPSAVAGSGRSSVTGTASDTVSTDARLPGQSSRAGSGSGATTELSGQHRQVPKPAPLPPLRGLTVAEIRAMLGVAPLPGQSEDMASAATGATSIIGAALDRYA